MKHPEAAKLMTHVMAHVHAENPTALSKALGGGWTDRDQQRKLYKWWRGEQAPNFEATITLLRAGGLLREDAGEAVLPLAEHPPEDRLRSLEAKVDRQTRATTKALRGLEAQLEHISALLEPPDQAASQGRR